jgi:hypothetical protein
MISRGKQTTVHRWMLAIGVVIFGILAVPMMAQAYFGTLMSPGGITGTGNWIYTGPTMLSWWVDQNTDQTWSYHYQFTHPSGATSHFILETSRNFTCRDVLSAEGDFSSWSVGTFEPHSGNPGMPGPIYGIKFDAADGLTTDMFLRTPRAPKWGDFYSKDGVAGEHGLNAAWNVGFTDPDVDPTAPAADGAVDYHILVPDTQTSPVPEPSGVLLLGAGLLGVGIVRIRGRRSA